MQNQDYHIWFCSRGIFYHHDYHVDYITVFRKMQKSKKLDHVSLILKGKISVIPKGNLHVVLRIRIRLLVCTENSHPNLKKMRNVAENFFLL